MIKYEYKVVGLSEIEKAKQPMQAFLNKLGQDGWKFSFMILTNNFVFIRDVFTARETPSSGDITNLPIEGA